MTNTMKQAVNGNGEKFTQGHCKLCRDGEHSDYGNGVYTKAKFDDCGWLVVCSEHLDDAIETKASIRKQIPSNETDEV